MPPNQRSYAWREKHVRNLLQDFNEAISDSAEDDEYFLGTVVLIQSTGQTPSIVDGQQRIATTTILLARVRDYLSKLGRDGSARAIEQGFLSNTDMETERQVARISLNLEDNHFFLHSILSPHQFDNKPRKAAQPARSSNRRLLRASNLIADFITSILKEVPVEKHADRMIRWVNFIEHSVRVLVVTANDEIGAYRMFETLNDRGLRASQADILKNYFFSKSGTRLGEAQMMWNTITTTIEPLTGDGQDSEEEDDVNRSDFLVTYLRHLWVITHGPTKARELAAQVKGEVSNETRTMNFLAEGSVAVQDYVALWSSKHPKWSTYKNTTRQYVETIADHLQVDQIRPLLFAVARHFDVVEADKAFFLFVSWSVRFLIFGGRGGMLDTQYSLRAKEVGLKQITKARELREAMKAYVPSDAEFQEAFAVARVSRPRLARYYLRALEKTKKLLPDPEWVSNEDVNDVNLEHVLPLNPGPEWRVKPEEAEAGSRLLGNMLLLKARRNVEIGNESFEQKKLAYDRSGYDLTKEVAKTEGNWTLEKIRQRQRAMAALAVKTWPVTFPEKL